MSYLDEIDKRILETQKDREKPHMVFAYILQEENERIIKIGCTSINPLDRLKAIQKETTGLLYLRYEYYDTYLSGALIDDLAYKYLPHLDFVPGRQYKQWSEWYTLYPEEAICALDHILTKLYPSHTPLHWTQCCLSVRGVKSKSDISEERRAEAKKLYASGLTMQQIAQQLGVTKGRVDDYLSHPRPRR